MIRCRAGVVLAEHAHIIIETGPGLKWIDQRLADLIARVLRHSEAIRLVPRTRTVWTAVNHRLTFF